METEEKSEPKRRKNKNQFTEKVRENPWVLSTLVLGLILLIVLGTNFIGGGNVSKDYAGKAVLDFVQAQTGEGELVEVTTFDDNFYEATILYQGSEIPLYVTKDGEYLVQGIMPLVSESEGSSSGVSTEVPTTDKPVTELYIWSYCPYGVTALGPFAEVQQLLGDAADFKVYLYYAGHGDFEIQQNKIQACMQDLGVEKYWEYAETFANEIYEKCYGDVDCDLTESKALMNKLGIDSEAVLACVDSKGETLLDEHYETAKDSGVSGSPTLMVNGVIVNVARTAESFKTAICSGFNEEPGACSTELGDTAATTTGSC